MASVECDRCDQISSEAYCRNWCDEFEEDGYERGTREAGVEAKRALIEPLAILLDYVPAAGLGELRRRLERNGYGDLARLCGMVYGDIQPRRYLYIDSES